MGEEWTELVWTSISLIALSIVLVIAFNFMQLGKTLTNEMYQDQAVVEQRQEIRNFLPYDETTLSGSEAFSAALDISGKGYFAMIVGCGASRVKEHTYGVIYHPSCDLRSKTANDNLRAQATCTYDKFVSASFMQRMQLAPSYAYCVTNVQGTARDYQNMVDDIARTALKNNNITFNDLTFKSHIVYDKLGTPIGLYLVRLNNGVEVV